MQRYIFWYQHITDENVWVFSRDNKIMVCNTRARLVIQLFKSRVKDMFFVVSMLLFSFFHFLSLFFFFFFHFLPWLFRANRNLNFQIVSTESTALSQELGWRVSFRTRCGKISWITQLQIWERISKKEKKIWILTWKRLDSGVLRVNQVLRKIVDWRFDKLNENHPWFFGFVCGYLLKIVYYRLQHQTKLCSSTCVNANCKVKRICS